MLSVVLSHTESYLVEDKFEILDGESVQKWYLKRGFQKVLIKESTHCLTFGKMSNGCFITGENKKIYLKK